MQRGSTRWAASSETVGRSGTVASATMSGFFRGDEGSVSACVRLLSPETTLIRDARRNGRQLCDVSRWLLERSFRATKHNEKNGEDNRDALTTTAVGIAVEGPTGRSRRRKTKPASEEFRTTDVSAGRAHVRHGRRVQRTSLATATLTVGQ